MNTTEIKSENSRPAKRGWRKHSDEFKARVIAQALQPHASMAAVALANGINANMLRNWVHASSLARRSSAAKGDDEDGNCSALSFVQLPMQAGDLKASPVESATSCVLEVQIQRGETKVMVSLPLGSDSAAWIREVLG
jgi:transposase-like protein